MEEAVFFPGVPMSAVNLKRLVDDFERKLILEALERTRGNQRRAAAELGVLPTTLNEKMRRHGLRACDRPGQASVASAVSAAAGRGDVVGEGSMR